MSFNANSYAVTKFFQDYSHFCGKKRLIKKIKKTTEKFFREHNHPISVPGSDFTPKFIKDLMDRRTQLGNKEISAYFRQIANDMWEQIVPASLSQFLIEAKKKLESDPDRNWNDELEELSELIKKEVPKISIDKEIFILTLFLISKTGGYLLFKEPDLFQDEFANDVEFVNSAIDRLNSIFPSEEEIDEELEDYDENFIDDLTDENLDSEISSELSNDENLDLKGQEIFSFGKRKEDQTSETIPDSSLIQTNIEDSSKTQEQNQPINARKDLISEEEKSSSATQEQKAPVIENQQNTAVHEQLKEETSPQSNPAEEKVNVNGSEENSSDAVAVKEPLFIRSDHLTGQLIRRQNTWYFHPLYEWKNGTPSYIPDQSDRFGSSGNITLISMNALFQSGANKLYSGALYNIDLKDSDFINNSTTQVKSLAISGLKLIREKRMVRADIDSDDEGYRRAFYVVEPASEDWSIQEDSIEVKIANHNTLPEEIGDLFNVNVLLNIGKYFIGPLLLVKNRMGNLTVKLHPRNSIRYIYDAYENTSDTLRPMDAIRLPEAMGAVFTYPRFTSHKEIDLIPDNELLTTASKTLSLEEEDIKKVLNWAQEISTAKDKSGSALTPERIERIKEIFSSNERAIQALPPLGTLIGNLLNSNAEEKAEFVHEAAKAFASDTQAMTLLYPDSEFQAGMRNLVGRKKQLEDQIQQLRDDYDKDKARYELEKQNSEAGQKIKDLNAQIVGLDQQIADKKRQLAQQEKERREREASMAEAESQLEGFEQRLNQTVDKVASLAFEGSLTAKIMAAADQWRAAKDDSTYKARVNALRNLHKSKESGKQLNDKLCRTLSQIRKYKHNDYVNLFVCLAQSFLTVLAGSPGSGKTSICNYVARMFGLTSLKDQDGIADLWADHPNYANRYIPVSVERGWTSKRDLIGYFNPLSRTFESVDPHRFECFKQLDYEAKEHFEELPYFLLLDEANLSPMEYYFADFMNICDIRNDLSFVSIGGDSRFQIPDSLRFLATINNDHTTEMLSPRLVDRTWIIQLPEIEELDMTPQKADKLLDKCELIDWTSFKQTYAASQKSNSQVQKDLKKISDVLSPLGLSLSPRTRNAISNYVSAAQTYMEKESNGRTPYKVALDFAVAQKVLPMINGSGEAYRKSLDALKQFLDSEHLTKSAAALQSVINKGTDAMDFYRFF